MGQTVAQRNRAVRQEALREQLQAQGHLQHVIDLLDKISNLDDKLDSAEIQRLKITVDTKLKLIGKYLPDLKATEITGEGGGELVTKTVVELVDTNNTDA